MIIKNLKMKTFSIKKIFWLIKRSNQMNTNNQTKTNMISMNLTKSKFKILCYIIIESLDANFLKNILYIII